MTSETRLRVEDGSEVIIRDEIDEQMVDAGDGNPFRVPTYQRTEVEIRLYGGVTLLIQDARRIDIEVHP